MGGGGVSEGEEGGGRRPPPPPQTPPPPQAKPNPPQPAPKKRKFSFESADESDDGAIPRPKRANCPPTTTTARPRRPRPQTHRPPTRPPPQTPPPPTKTDTPKGAKKKDDRPEDTIIGTVVHVPYPKGVEKGTVRGIHGRKYGAVWVEYPGGTTLYEVNRSLLFPSPEEAERHREEAQKKEGQKKTKPPTPTNEESNPPNANPTTEPTNPPNPTNRANPPSGPAKMRDPSTGSHEV